MNDVLKPSETKPQPKCPGCKEEVNGGQRYNEKWCNWTDYYCDHCKREFKVYDESILDRLKKRLGFKEESKK